jgi:hypothetical protein
VNGVPCATCGKTVEMVGQNHQCDACAHADPVNHPPHYTDHPSGIECIQITEHMGFNLGNVIKYVWRCDLKLDAIEDLRKARFYLDREIAKREAAADPESRCMIDTH